MLLPQLLDRGWGPYGARVPDEPRGVVVISPDRLQLVVDHHVLLSGVNPAAPAGWWPAVDRLHSCCVVVITADGDIDLTDPRTGDQLAALMGTGRAVFAALPVRTNLQN